MSLGDLFGMKSTSSGGRRKSPKGHRKRPSAHRRRSRRPMRYMGGAQCGMAGGGEDGESGVASGVESEGDSGVTAMTEMSNMMGQEQAQTGGRRRSRRRHGRSRRH